MHPQLSLFPKTSPLPQSWKEGPRDRGREEQKQVSEERRKHLHGRLPHSQTRPRVCARRPLPAIKEDPSRTVPFRANNNVQTVPGSAWTDSPTPLPPLPLPDRLQWAWTGGRGDRGWEPETWGQFGERRRLAYREWETKSYTGIWTVFPWMISLRVLKMSSLSKASGGNQGVTMFLPFQMTSPVTMPRAFLQTCISHMSITP